MSISVDSLGELVDRLANLKTALAQLNGACTADKHLLGLEAVANAARALFDDDRQTTALRLFANPASGADMEPMIETGNGGYAYMDELAKYRIYGLHDMFNFEPATFICHNGEIWRCVIGPHERNGARAVKHKLVPVSGEMRIFDAADYRKTGKPWPTASTSLKAGGWQSPEDKARVVHGSVRHQYGGKQPVLWKDDQEHASDSEEEGEEEIAFREELGLPGAKRARA